MRRDFSLYLFGAITGVSLVALVSAARNEPAIEVVRAQAFELYDEEGRQVGYWNTGWQGTRFKMWGSDSLAEYSAITFKEGEVTDPASTITLRRPDGASLSLTTGGGIEGPRLTLYGADGPRATLSAGYESWGHGQLIIFDVPTESNLFQIPER